MWRRLVAGMAVALAAGCGAPPPPPPIRPNVLVVLADTLRADRLDAYGNPRALTPFLDTLAAHATVFTRAYSTAGWTAPSVASLFTGRHPSEHGVFSLSAAIPESVPKLPELLGAAGYATASFTASLMIMVQRRGFDEFRVVPWENIDGVLVPARARTVTREAVAWYAAHRAASRAPVLLYVHLMETHPPYAPGMNFLVRTRREGMPNVAAAATATLLGNSLHTGPSALPNVEAVYDATTMELDVGLRDLFQQLSAAGFFDDALTIFTADHGEGFLEHGYWGHGNEVYDELLHVPLIVALPHQRDGRRVDAVVSLADVVPTLCALTGIPPPRTSGRSFADLLIDRPWFDRARLGTWWAARDRDAVAEGTRRVHATDPESYVRAIVRADEKLVVEPDGTQRLYDLASAAGDRTPVASSARESALRARLDAALGGMEAAGTATAAHPLDPDTQRRLQALGYVDDGRPAPPR